MRQQETAKLRISRTRSIVNQKIIASELLSKAVKNRKIHLLQLVADTGLWVNPKCHSRLVDDTGSAAKYPKVRRAHGKKERKGQIVEEDVRLDDNTYANLAIKVATGLDRGRAQGFEACHIWPGTCYTRLIYHLR